ncbi:MAG TPA: mercury resistance system periplasmic binding protein MerP [Acidiferrobacterales bacterium]|nr:mercury resistance system periplasmic binding protein MerP [Acidiferrobacterales bacterium]
MINRALLSIVFLSFISFFNNPAFAVPKTVTLNVPGMTCSLCPVTVKKSLEKVSGVADVKVSFENKHAVVIFDDSKTSIEALQKATTDAGYPSTILKKP